MVLWACLNLGASSIYTATIAGSGSSFSPSSSSMFTLNMRSSPSSNRRPDIKMDTSGSNSTRLTCLLNLASTCSILATCPISISTLARVLRCLLWSSALISAWFCCTTSVQHIQQTMAVRPTEQTLKGKTTEVQTKRSSCPETSPHLVGPLRVDFNWNRTMESVRTDLGSTLLEGGRYKPPDCISHHKVAIIIPFRNRHQHLIQWLYYLHPILQRQQLDYGVYIINQDGEGIFNKARLMNAGFAEALKEYNYTCFVFSDVDLIPINDRNIYGCFSKPKHLSVAVDKFGFMLPYSTIFGGVVSLSKEQFSTINGFSNSYWGWGGEDDDIYQRIATKSMGIIRPDLVTGRFKMIKHKRDVHNELNLHRIDILQRTSSTMEEDGINSLRYTINKIEKDTLYTFITVDIGNQTHAAHKRLGLGLTTS